MTLSNLDRAAVLICHPTATERETVRTILTNLGFQRFVQAKGLTEATAELAARGPHLLILDLGGDADLNFVRGLRHGVNGPDPFLPIVVTCTEVTDQLAKRVADIGADQLWRLPLNQAAVETGITSIVENRPPFVVTTDYIGPDRRKGFRPGRQIPRVRVPNALRQKLTHEHPPVSHGTYCRFIDRLRVERQVEQVKWLLDQLQRADENRRRAIASRLETVADDMITRIPRTRHHLQLRICKNLREAAAAFYAEGDHLARLDDVYNQLSWGIQPVVACGADGGVTLNQMVE